jgi:hypothetical protein
VLAGEIEVRPIGIWSRTSVMNSNESPVRAEHREGPIARAIEEQTAKLPSDTFLWAALASIALSLGLRLRGRQHEALFVGHWVSTFLLLGIYNKLVKLHGSDRLDH